jgi:hypothetical protein
MLIQMRGVLVYLKEVLGVVEVEIDHDQTGGVAR